MATATPPVSPKASYPAEAVNRLFAPPEREVPADKLRRLLHEARAKRSRSSIPPAPTTPSRRRS